MMWNLTRNTRGSLKANMEVCRKRINELDLIEGERNLPYDEKVERDALKQEFLLFALKDEIFWR